MPESRIATLTPAPALAGPPPCAQASVALISARSGSAAVGEYNPSYSARWACGAAAIVARLVPLSCTATAFNEISYSPVTLALGALACNQDLKSLRSAESWARYDLTVELLK